MDFKVEIDKIDGYHPEDDIIRATDMLNNLVDDLKNGGYREGRRNNVAVDLCILCYVLDLDPLEVGGYYIKNETGAKVFSYPVDHKIKDLEDRIDTISNYLSEWDRYDIFQFMMMDWDGKADLGYIGIVR